MKIYFQIFHLVYMLNYTKTCKLSQKIIVFLTSLETKKVRWHRQFMLQILNAKRQNIYITSKN